ncbi:Ig-like domain-containing protein [Planctomycetota bacterium]
MKKNLLIAGLILIAGLGWSSDWMLTKADMKYVGGFRLPKGSAGKGKNDHFAFSPGVIAYDTQRNSFFAAGHGYAKAIAEISYPGLTDSVDISKFPRAVYIQNFRNLLDGLPSGNPDKVGVIGGLYAEKGAILFTAFQYYDAPAKVRDAFGVVKDSGKLASSALDGYFETGYGAHTAGWVTAIPEEYRESLKGTHIIGAGKSQPIASRWPLRPTAFSFTWPKDNIFKDPLPVNRLMDGSLKDQLPKEMWQNALDSANYGIIIPGTRTYICFGNRGGMHSKIGYKITTDDGRLAGGYAAQDDDDHYMYYWMFKVDDLIKSAQGRIAPVKVLPYERGKLALPFVSSGGGGIGGGSWDPKTKTVFLCLKGRDRASQYSILPAIVGVQFEKYKGKDTTAPYGTMTEPNNGKKVKGQIPIEAHAIDNVDKENELKVQFTVNSKDHNKPATEFPFRIDWDTSKVANGKYILSAIAVDKAGNKRKLNDVAVTVEN